ncbi:sporulation protein [Pontibacter qinzhouensis]|uniref:Sporulation protein n=1 Tax=Pontibacter qinzhouensis TaxID=2603253 RepID=A0A5C8KCZ9_9BACT|nr:spore germination protein GerW family protein [Pontibacter qinzhouensis]TXK52658.1 sporulation protein [Pontibacter qinzhouensis]
METPSHKSPSSGNNFVERLAEKVGLAAKASTVYGDPIERGGVTVVPVSKLAYGFGGGAGNKAGEEGSGGGGGIAIMPVGYIEIKEGTTKYKAIRDPQTVVKIIAVSGLFSVLLVRSVAKLLRK